MDVVNFRARIVPSERNSHLSFYSAFTVINLCMVLRWGRDHKKNTSKTSLMPLDNSIMNILDLFFSHIQT